MLIGQVLKLSFAEYSKAAAWPTLTGLTLTWAVLAWQSRGRWLQKTPLPVVEAPPFDRWQTAKGLLVILALVSAFIYGPWPREVVALSLAGVLLCSRRMHTSRMLSLVDWPLLLLFIGLFVVNHALAASGLLGELTGLLAQGGLDLSRPGWLFGASAVLSNLVSNVPAVMLLLPSAGHPLAGPVLALSSTLAGNLFLVGSIANIIVVDQAARLGVYISWRDHARTGVPVTLLTLAAAAAWLGI
jgi:Na+/H+ antiporter NhaD/arsenite permease-like protein